MTQLMEQMEQERHDADGALRQEQPRSTPLPTVADSSQSTETTPMMSPVPSEASAVVPVASTSKGSDSTIRWSTWCNSYNAQSSKLKKWAEETQTPLQWHECTIEGHSSKYCSMLKSGTIEPNLEVGVPFLLWMCEHPDSSYITPTATKDAMNYLVACCNIEIVQKGNQLKRIPPGSFNSEKVKIAMAERKKRVGESAIEGRGVRADHCPTYKEQVVMMELSLAGDKRVGADVLRVLQIGAEFRLAAVTGVRGEKVRSATLGHVWPKECSSLVASHESVLSPIVYLIRRVSV